MLGHRRLVSAPETCDELEEQEILRNLCVTQRKQGNDAVGHIRGSHQQPQTERAELKDCH